VNARPVFVALSQDKHRFPAHHGSVSDQPPESRPEPPPEPDSTSTRVLPPDREPAGPQKRFADRLWSLRAVIAVALASVILGGLGGAALASAGDDHDGRGGGPFPGRMQRGGPMGPPGTQKWHWNDGPQRRGQGERQWRQDGGPNVVPPTPSPAKPTPKD
jgi:hypothetical protein